MSDLIIKLPESMGSHPTLLVVVTDGTGEGTLVFHEGTQLQAKAVHIRVQLGEGGICNDLSANIRLRKKGPPP